MTEVRRFTVTGVGEGREDYSAPVLGPNAKEMRTERRSTTSNDSDIVDGTAPPNLRTDVDYEGKFFTRGCRGMIEQIQIYCMRTGAGTLTLRYSPHPCIGPFGTVVITPGAAWAWVAADIEEMWNYDSLFIWVHDCSADVSWAFDAVLPLDGHESDDGGATWADLAIRPFIRAVYTGETAGDVPVSGIINNIPIPNLSSQQVRDNQLVPVNVVTLISEVNGAGFVDMIMMAVAAAGSSQLTVFRLFVDGVECWTWTPFDMNNWGFNDDTQPMSLLQYGANAWCRIMVTKRWEFRRSFQIFANNNIGGVNVYTRMYPNLMR